MWKNIAILHNESKIPPRNHFVIREESQYVIITVMPQTEEVSVKKTQPRHFPYQQYYFIRRQVIRHTNWFDTYVTQVRQPKVLTNSPKRSAFSPLTPNKESYPLHLLHLSPHAYDINVHINLEDNHPRIGKI